MNEIGLKKIMFYFSTSTFEILSDSSFAEKNPSLEILKSLFFKLRERFLCYTFWLN